MRSYLCALPILTMTGSSVGAQVPGQCISGCNIPNPQQQQPQQTDPNLARVFHFQAIQSSSDFWLREANRPERLPAISQLNLPIRDKTSLLTGPAGNAKFTLADQTSVSLGPGTELVIDSFERSSRGSATVSMRLVKGKMRWTTRVLQSIFNRILPQIRIGRDAGATRGTDFEIVQDVNGSGYVRVYSGVFVYTEANTGKVYEVNPGQQLSWQNSTVSGIETWGE